MDGELALVRGTVDLSPQEMGRVTVVFHPSDRPLPSGDDGPTLYDVYVEGEYAGLVADTGLESPGG